MQSLDDTANKKESKFTLEKVAEVADILSDELDIAIDQVDDVNKKTQLVSLNAAIEAARAGEAGKAFGVVASYISDLSEETGKITTSMRTTSRQKIHSLGNMIKTQAKDYRGSRLTNMALVNIDLIDRNLFERSADIQWWATDVALVDALTKGTQESYDHASERLSIILDAYTVYHDLILYDLDGNVVTNGRPLKYNRTGQIHTEKASFQSSIKNDRRKKFARSAVHKSDTMNNQIILEFSSLVHEKANLDSKNIGVLTSVFDWKGLVQTIINNTPLDAEEKTRSRICIVDDNGLILGDSDGKILEEKIEFNKRKELFEQDKNYTTTKINGIECLVGHAVSPGYEGYKSGWRSLIIQKIE